MDKLRKLWPYHPDDKSTWKYIDCLVSGDYGQVRRVRKWILNPDFAYRHLDPHDSENDHV